MLIAKLHAVTDFPQPAVGEVMAKICQPLSVHGLQHLRAEHIEVATARMHRVMTRRSLDEAKCAVFSLDVVEICLLWGSAELGRGANGSDESPCSSNCRPRSFECLPNRIQRKPSRKDLVEKPTRAFAMIRSRSVIVRYSRTETATSAS